MAGKKHATGEIATKLAQASDMAARGKTQREISKALGVSTMTYHRWKKMLGGGQISLEPVADDQSERQLRTSSDVDSDETIDRLKSENAQLRRLVTDVLLEKLKLEDEIRSRQEARFPRPGKGK